MSQSDAARQVSPIRLGAVDNHPVVLGGLRAATEQVPDVDFVATAPDVPALLAAAEDLDVVLLDLRLSDLSRPRDNVAALVAAGARVLVFTVGHPEFEREAVRAGALGVLIKDVDERVVLDGIRTVANGDVLDNAALARALDQSGPLVAQLSPREAEALRLYAAGLLAKQVARRMGVTEGTAKKFLSRVRAKYADLDRPASTRMELYRRAVEDGLIPPVAPGDDAQDGAAAVPAGESDDAADGPEAAAPHRR